MKELTIRTPSTEQASLQEKPDDQQGPFLDHLTTFIMPFGQEGGILNKPKACIIPPWTAAHARDVVNEVWSAGTCSLVPGARAVLLFSLTISTDRFGNQCRQVIWACRSITYNPEFLMSFKFIRNTRQAVFLLLLINMFVYASIPHNHQLNEFEQGNRPAEPAVR